MSYVLDALEKSERERQQHNPPHLLSVHTTEPSFRNNRRKKIFSLIWGLIFVILILLVGTIYVISYYTKQEVEIQNQPVTTNTPSQRRIVINPEVNTILTETASFVDSEDELELVNITAEKKKIRFTIPDEANNSVEETEAIPADTIPLLKELSSELQKEIPDLKFSGHAYATDPEKRMLIVNNQILREGDSINSVTTLKEITWEGAVIDFGGVLFQIEIQ